MSLHRHKHARTTHRPWPDRCAICDRFLTRRAGSHRHRCTAHMMAGLVPARRCA